MSVDIKLKIGDIFPFIRLIFLSSLESQLMKKETSVDIRFCALNINSLLICHHTKFVLCEALNFMVRRHH